MIFGILRRLVFGLIRKIVLLIAILVAATYFIFFRGEGDGKGLSGVTNWVMGILGNDVRVKIESSDGNFEWKITEPIKKQIDAWLAANQLNEYGDEPGTVYAGGTPLFDESTGETSDRYKYLLEKYPELQELLKQ